MTVPENDPGSAANRGVSLIRTYVPLAWGALITWATTQVPAWEPYLNAPAVLGLGAVLTAVVTAAWYSLMRVVEPKLPPWLTRVVLGSNLQPKYVEPVLPAVVSRAEMRIPRQAE